MAIKFINVGDVPYIMYLDQPPLKPPPKTLTGNTFLPSYPSLGPLEFILAHSLMPSLPLLVEFYLAGNSSDRS